MIRWRQWLENILRRVRTAANEPDEPAETAPHLRSVEERSRFWAEFRAGQREADERGRTALQRPEPVTR